MTPRFLTLERVLAIHQYQLEHFGGLGGVRDRNLLHSAIAAPTATFGGQFLHTDLCEMAAAYLYHLVKNHAFLDGNKRVGAAAAAMFIELNDLRFTADPDAYADLTLSVARGDASKSEVAEFFRKNTAT